MLSLSNPQDVFLRGLNTKFRAYVGGYGSGKTFVVCIDLLMFFGMHPRTRQGYFGVSYPSIRDIFYPTFEEAAHMMGFTIDIKATNKEVHVYRNGQYYGTVICRSMDNPASIIGFKISRAGIDEIDTLPADKAVAAWQKIIARMRLVIDGVENGISLATTPEGFRFVYSRFADNPTESYSMVQASSHENSKFLPPDYIPSLLETYDEFLVDAYVKGQFVNLTSGTVYRNYDREQCKSTEVIREGEPLYIGQDFNVGNMASVVHVKRGKEYHAVAELTGGTDTPDTVETIRQKWPDNTIYIYPDASGGNRSSKSASVSDISILRQSFKVRANNANPLIKDRVLAMNAALSNGLLKVNPDTCPEYVKCLEQQAYDKNGVPDKSAGHDHLVDAGGYLIAYEYPINKPVIKPQPITGMY